MSKPTPEQAAEILEQIGWNRDDTCFVSLNLTQEQLNVLARNVGPGESAQELMIRCVNSHAQLVEACRAAHALLAAHDGCSRMSPELYRVTNQIRTALSIADHSP